ncbi:alpha/beta hydrolase [Zhaonella formicivorans]|jgi:alpha-beta hydrolase superfamily lysophospholipase|uniref:alpha/beta hydrolase n=1 Tax=Zhaonella formicivorans TaxID=2528593 RepID=UPI0010ED4F75|nr:alpha/beta hydrolase [Zhaonella formicivorans]
MEHFTFQWQTGDGLRLFAQGWRPEGPKAVVGVVHGLGEHGGRYLKLAQFLVPEGYAVLTFDQRGFGRSEGRRGHTPGYDFLLDDIDEFLQQAALRFPGKPRFLYGHSMGGNLVLNYALRRKPKLSGVIATGPWLRLAFEPPPWKICLAKIMNMVMPAFTQSNGLRSRDLSHDAESVHSYEHDPLVHDRISARLFTGVYEAGLWALGHAAQFDLPLLLMHGGADRITSPEASHRFASQVPVHCTFKLWPGLYHELFNESQKEEVARFLTTWLDECS